MSQHSRNLSDREKDAILDAEQALKAIEGEPNKDYTNMVADALGWLRVGRIDRAIFTISKFGVDNKG